MPPRRRRPVLHAACGDGWLVAALDGTRRRRLRRRPPAARRHRATRLDALDLRVEDVRRPSGRRGLGLAGGGGAVGRGRGHPGSVERRRRSSTARRAALAPGGVLVVHSLSPCELGGRRRARSRPTWSPARPYRPATWPPSSATLGLDATVDRGRPTVATTWCGPPGAARDPGSATRGDADEGRLRHAPLRASRSWEGPSPPPGSWPSTWWPSAAGTVEVFTTCALDHITWDDVLPAGDSVLNGVTVHRFASASGRVPRVLRARRPASAHGTGRGDPGRGPAVARAQRAGDARPRRRPARRATPTSSPSTPTSTTRRSWAWTRPRRPGGPASRRPRRARAVPARCSTPPSPTPTPSATTPPPSAGSCNGVHRVAQIPQIVLGLGVAAVVEGGRRGGEVLGIGDRPYVVSVGRVDEHKGSVDAGARSSAPTSERHPGPLALALVGPGGGHRSPATTTSSLTGAVSEADKWDSGARRHRGRSRRRPSSRSRSWSSRRGSSRCPVVVNATVRPHPRALRTLGRRAVVRLVPRVRGRPRAPVRRRRAARAPRRAAGHAYVRALLPVAAAHRPLRPLPHRRGGAALRRTRPRLSASEPGHAHHGLVETDRPPSSRRTGRCRKRRCHRRRPRSR